MLESLKAPLLVLHFSYHILMTFLIMVYVILLSMLMILLSNLSVIRHLISDQQLELVSELPDTVDWGRKWLVDFNAGKTQLVSFDWFSNTGTIYLKMNGSVLEEKSSFKMLGLTFSSNLDWGSYIISIVKTACKKIGTFIGSVKFFFLRFCLSP